MHIQFYGSVNQITQFMMCNTSCIVVVSHEQVFIPQTPSNKVELYFKWRIVIGRKMHGFIQNFRGLYQAFKMALEVPYDCSI